MKKIFFLFFLFQFVFLNNSFAKKGDVKIISSNNDYLKIGVEQGVFKMSESDFARIFSDLDRTSKTHCSRTGSKPYIFKGDINGKANLQSFREGIYSGFIIYCAKTLQTALDHYHKYNFKPRFDTLPTNSTDSILNPDANIVNVSDQLELEKKIKEENKKQEDAKRVRLLNKQKTCKDEVKVSWNLTSYSAPFKFTSNSNKTIKIFNVSLVTADNSLIKSFYKNEYIKPFHVWSDSFLTNDLNKDAIKYLTWNCKYEEQEIKNTSNGNSGRSYAKNVLKGKFNSALISAIFAAIGGVIGFFVRGHMGGVIGAIIAVVISKLL